MAGTCVDCGKPLAETCMSFEPIAPVEAKEEPVIVNCNRTQDPGVEAREGKLCPQCGNPKDDPRSDSIERMLVCGHSFHEKVEYEADSGEREDECRQEQCNGPLPDNCPKCGKPIWGEGWNPETGVRYFSHIPKFIRSQIKDRQKG